MLLSLLLGVLVGAVLGLTGAGGGILAVPALVVGMGWSMQQAAPVALVAVAGGAAVGKDQTSRPVAGLMRPIFKASSASTWSSARTALRCMRKATTSMTRANKPSRIR